MMRALPISQRGSVIIVTLWTITLLAILITALAGQSRLSAKTAFYHKEELQTWSHELAAMNQAELELLLERMDPLPRSLDAQIEDPRNPWYRFNGRKLQLNVPQAEGMTVRIYDQAGKINLNEISRPRLRALLEKKLGGDDADPIQLDNLMAAWGDWQDLNDLAGVNGAEADYYQKLEHPYTPRNGRLETVEELLLIRGFADVFSDVDLDAAFTLYGENELVNLNLATVEAMRLLPGLDDALIAKIIAYREENEFHGNGDVAQIIPAENMAQLRPWLNSNKTTSYYSIVVYPEPPAEADAVTKQAGNDDAVQIDETPISAYAEIVRIDSYTNRPRVIKTNPYQVVPARARTAGKGEQ